MNVFADRLKIIMSGLSVRKFAERLGMSPTTVQEYIKGRTPPSDFIVRVCERFNVDSWWLLTGEGEMAPRLAGVHQVATGDGHIQVGGSVSGQVVGGRGNKASVGREAAAGTVSVNLDEVIRVLEDYVSPKVIEEIRERLKAGR